MEKDFTNRTGMSLEEKWNSLTIADNFIFYKVMRHNPDVCKHLIEILLEIEIERIDMNQQEEIDIDFTSKGVRLDVYAKNSTQAFNIEMQATDTKELPERARYYQGVIDVDLLKSGQKYRELKDSYIIFICINDIFKKGLAKYTFENLCTEDTRLRLGDRTQKLFFIAENCDKILNEEQRAFLRLVTSNESKGEFAAQISKLVDEAKQNNQWRFQYMTWERQRAYDFDAGMEKKAIEDAILLVKEFNVTPELAAKKMDAPLEKVLEHLNSPHRALSLSCSSGSESPTASL